MSESTAKGNPLGRGERLQIMLDVAELDALDNFRFTNRLPSRAAAVRELLKRGLAAEGLTIEPRHRSQAYGVIDSPEASSDDS